MRKFIFGVIILFVSVISRANDAADMMLIKAIQDDNLREAKYWLEHGTSALLSKFKPLASNFAICPAIEIGCF